MNGLRCRKCDLFPCQKNSDPNQGVCEYTPSRYPEDVKRPHAACLAVYKKWGHLRCPEVKLLADAIEENRDFDLPSVLSHQEISIDKPIWQVGKVSPKAIS